jgi:DNA modification methylase
MGQVDEFKSELENIMPAEELTFPSSPGFGKYKGVMPPEAVGHPAKFNTNLVEFLILRYTEPGDVVLDCMAGSGVLGVIAALHGRNAIQVELEKRFHEWMEKARENVERYPSLTRKGWIVNVLGDARRLSELLSKVGFEPAAVVTSPPYTNSAAENPNVVELQKKGWVKGGDLSRFLPENLSSDNIGNLPFGSVDVTITSPPYGESHLGGGDPERRKERLIKAGYDPKDFLGGRARNAVLKHYDEVDAVITSPPYADTKKGGTVDEEAMAERWDKLFKEKGKTWNSWGKTWHTPGRLRGLETLGSGYSENKDNIGNLPLGNIDAVITSPPYAETAQDSNKSPAIIKPPRPQDVRQYPRKPPINKYSDNPANIGNLPLGEIDAVITSPPYLKSAEHGAGVNRQREGDVKIGCSTVGRTVEHPDAIDNAKDYGSIDAIITSPPYEGGFEGGSRHTGGILEREKSDAETRLKIGLGVKYSDSESNIGNLKSSDEEYEALARGLMTRDGKPTYLSEMLKVYAQMFKVLKPNGLAIVVIKPFIRNRKVVDLPYHTWLLMAKVGFKLEKLYKLRLKTQSFWRILYYRRFPTIPRIAHEYILVCRKP